MAEDIPPCHIRIDKEGNWYYQDLPIINQEIYLHLNKCLRRDPSGKYTLLMNDEKCYLEVEDTPFVIQEVSLKSVPKCTSPLFIKLNDLTEEELKVDTLRVGKDNVLYCKVKDELYDARFLRASYYQLAKFLHYDGERYYLLFEGKKTYPQHL
ncbi:MAG: hypothetical protein AMJ42_06715 [Deltaproteobacteria bacterium DG_8]|nr:MAG: hypothetical protein AMJ42_06715 [Deltaproteobacteria bacterium DG_8]